MSRQEDKLAALLHVVTEVIPGGQPTIVFASTRHHVELVAQLLRADGVASAHVYGTMDQVRVYVSAPVTVINPVTSQVITAGAESCRVARTRDRWQQSMLRTAGHTTMALTIFSI